MPPFGTIVTIARWLAGVPLSIIALWALGFNGAALWMHYVLKRKAGSLAPLFGGILGSLSLLILPVAALHRWWFVPLVADVSIWQILYLPFYLLRQSREDG